MKLLLLVAAIISTVVATLTAVTFILAMGANSSEAELRTLKMWGIAISLLGVSGVATGVVLWRAGQTTYAAGAAFVPVPILVVIAIIAIATSG